MTDSKQIQFFIRIVMILYLSTPLYVQRVAQPGSEGGLAASEAAF